jgi:glutaredoxin
MAWSKKTSSPKHITNNNYKENNMKAIVWSKNHCPYCDQAKNLLKLKGIDYEERNINDGWDKEDLMAAVPNARTVPQIFLDDQLIGGFTELRKHFSTED